ncbi:MAG: polymer-forming cytoskeletal protein [Clostridiales bacterium]|nr:polymer-forming cytoskeletal protein [Clostridiales bacterium]
MITRNGGFDTMDFEQQTPTDEVASITEGMIVKGDIATTGSLELIGKITGNIKCLGKLNITGEINGDSDAAEVYAESARITGEIKSKGSVKVGQSTVIVGNIFGSSAVIAGAVKGDIDVHGPVVLDTTAIVMGNIKSQSVQINNGAVIEGMCSQAYADVNPSEFFEGLKNK